MDSAWRTGNCPRPSTSRDQSRPATVDQLGAVIVFAAIVAVLVVVGIRVGMLIAPRIDRLSGSEEEGEGADDD